MRHNSLTITRGTNGSAFLPDDRLLPGTLTVLPLLAGATNPVQSGNVKTAALFLVMVALVYGDSVNVDLRFPKLRLKNGTTLSDVRLLSVDSDEGTANVLIGKSMKQLEVKSLPDDLIKQLEILAPKTNEADLIKRQQRAAEAEFNAQKRAHRDEDSQAQAKANREAQRKSEAAPPETPEEKTAATEVTIAKAAEDYARYYFNYQDDPHSSVGAVLNMAFQLEPPEQVQGWTGRWRVKGTVGSTYVTNTGGSVGRKAKDFEILLETRDKGKPKIVDLTVK
jgi:hypothetical protein